MWFFPLENSNHRKFLIKYSFLSTYAPIPYHLDKLIMKQGSASWFRILSHLTLLPATATAAIKANISIVFPCLFSFRFWKTVFAILYCHCKHGNGNYRSLSQKRVRVQKIKGVEERLFAKRNHKNINFMFEQCTTKWKHAPSEMVDIKIRYAIYDIDDFSPKKRNSPEWARSPRGRSIMTLLMVFNNRNKVDGDAAWITSEIYIEMV